MADTARGEPHEHLARSRLREIERLDPERLAELLEHGGENLHVSRTLPRLRGVDGRYSSVTINQDVSTTSNAEPGTAWSECRSSFDQRGPERR